ncbi:archaeal proteasome endopeptidase complex subunit alpha [Candidatus Woesearchaeota archaeon]|nr:archaeal proteasome endopeptidase complex subunit alpha [Candidatus Woesearchaeota archaeon]
MQPTMNHQIMGYDRSSTMFSPDGRLLQVEYAKKAVRQGTISVGVVCKDGVLLIGDKRLLDKLVVSKSIEKVFKIDDHVVAVATGYLMDGRVLIERAQLMAQQHKITYDTEVDILSLVKEIANIKQAYTQYGGSRPFGVSIMFGGVDDEGPQLFVTDVTGMYFEYKATAVGENYQQVKEILDKEYQDNMTMEDGLKMSLNALKTVFSGDFDIDKLDCIYIHKTNGIMRFKSENLKKIIRK